MQLFLEVVTIFIVPISIAGYLLSWMLKHAPEKLHHYRLFDPLFSSFLIALCCLAVDYMYLPEIVVSVHPEKREPIYLFMRSGAMMTVAGIFRTVSLKPQTPSNVFNHILTIAGTLIWGYGDLWVLIMRR